VKVRIRNSCLRVAYEAFIGSLAGAGEVKDVGSHLRHRLRKISKRKVSKISQWKQRVEHETIATFTIMFDLPLLCSPGIGPTVVGPRLTRY
jgi:hypothetical protein